MINKITSLLVFFLFVSFCHGQNTDQESLRLLIMGNEDYGLNKAVEFVAEEMDIDLVRMDISLSRKTLDSIEAQNAQMWEKLDDKLQLNSKQVFRTRLTEENEKIASAEDIYRTDAKAKRLRKKLEKDGIETHAELEKKRAPFIYIYTVYSLDKSISESAKKPEFHVVVDIKDISSKVEEL
ncbi:hypothetical protein [Flagellimonas zhangzhouensis]|uniref:OmpH family outer membrane protein n=1 Tax=Flagellimonas zhangzhouensis TaxID=1073328 RepID=A0A1H2Z7U2_9FLAO|nr:hypothetical protein [Allomuricauda zhangzhouensis]SDR07603.1 hypothetical protein SAMN05216294_3346 [Allomuricauda zhangzhouensis]SDX13395.1 hypothetical protein SAMN04487892_3341 [Allomuricauda zhangzhouensis]